MRLPSTTQRTIGRGMSGHRKLFLFRKVNTWYIQEDTRAPSKAHFETP